MSVVGLALTVTAAVAHAGELRAGAARVSITPTADEFPYQIGREKPFVEVHDDVYARALVLDDGKTRVALVVEEVESVPDPKGTVSQVAQALGVPETNVIVSATHTHESLTVFIHGNQLTPAQQAEIEHCRSGAVEAAKQAAADLQPAKISFGRGEAYVNINNGEEARLQGGQEAAAPGYSSSASGPA
jgi:predicted neutral ceramidase superfamily lipid hydrolase